MALEFLAIVEEEKLLENVNKVGAYLQQELKTIVEKRAAAKGVRGRGFIQGIQLEIPARPIVDAALAEGVLFNQHAGYGGAVSASVLDGGEARR